MMTPWFNKYTRPHHIGVYPTRVNVHVGCYAYNHWNGVFWGLACQSAKDAEASKSFSSHIQNIEWRGFTEEQR